METTEVNISKLCEAVAYGDSAGLPVETKSNAEIAIQYGRIDRLLSSKNNPFFSGEHKPGTWSDDTQLTLAVAESLVAEPCFEINSQAEAHIRAYKETPIVNWKGKDVPRGWGGSTTNSVRRLIQGVSPHESGEPGGEGNGVLMKLSPLAAFAKHFGGGSEEAEDLTLMTHKSDLAVACSVVHLEVLKWLAYDNCEEDDLIETLEYGIDEGFIALKILGGGRYSEATNKLKDDFAFLFDEKHPVKKPIDVLENTDGKGFHAPQTLAMAYGAFIIESTFPKSVYTAVNLGGDTDSTGSIIASMSLFWQKDVEFPEDASLLDQRDRLQKTSRDLAKLVRGRG